MDVKNYSNFINTFDKAKMLPGGIRAQLSTNQYNKARNAIKMVLEKGEQSAVLGTTSGGFCSHNLVRTETGELYIVTSGYGSFIDAYYLTPDYVSNIFEDFENEKPIWKPSERIQKLLDNQRN